MTLRRHRLGGLIFVVAALAACAPHTVVGERQPRMLVLTIVHDGDFFYASPILSYHGYVYEDPCRSTGEVEKWILRNLALGSHLTVVSSGGKIGTARVLVPPDASARACFGLQARVELSLEYGTSLEPEGSVLAVAGPFEGARRRVHRFTLGRDVHHTEGQIHQLLIEAGVPAGAAAVMRVSGHSVDLFTNGREDVLDAYTSYDEVTEDGWHTVLQILRRNTRGELKAIFSDHHHTARQQEGEHCAIRFMDVIDLDGDGVLELFTTLLCYEGVAYRVYKFDGGSWRSVYEGAYSGL